MTSKPVPKNQHSQGRRVGWITLLVALIGFALGVWRSLTRIAAEHLGHFTRLPSSFSWAWNLVPHPAHWR